MGQQLEQTQEYYLFNFFIDYFDYTDYYFIKINYSMENNRLDRDYENEFIEIIFRKVLNSLALVLTCACVSLILAFFL
jgi:hypothetical protein